MVAVRTFAGFVALVIAVLSGCASTAPTTVPTPTQSSAPPASVGLPTPPVPSPTINLPTASPSASPGASTSATGRPTSSASGPTTTGTLPPELSGTFAARIAPSDVPAADQSGDWFLVFTSTTGYEFGRVARGTAENTGDLTIDGDQVTFSNERGAGACPGSGVYSWAVTGQSLVLTLVRDACAVRVAQYVSQPYTLCPSDAVSCRDILPSS